MKIQAIEFNEKSVLVAEKFGVENLKLIIEMAIGIIEIVKDILNRRLRLLTVFDLLRKIRPFIRAMQEHGKDVLSEIKDLSSAEFEELSQHIMAKFPNKNIEDVIAFIQLITTLKK